MAWLLSMLSGCALVGVRTPSAPAPNPGSATNVAPASRATSVTLPSLTSTAVAPTSELPSQLPIRLDGTTQVWNGWGELLSSTDALGRVTSFEYDGLGRTNVSAIGDWHNPKVRLPGGGGGAVMLPTARRAVTWRTEHSKRTMVEKLDFVTAAGGMHGVVTPIAVFVKRDGRLALQSWHPDCSLEEVRSRTGFPFDASAAKPTSLPTAREVEALRALDPKGQFERDAKVALR